MKQRRKEDEEEEEVEERGRGGSVSVCVAQRVAGGNIDKALYRSVRTGPIADRYVDRSLPGDTAKIDRRGSIEREKLKKKKKRRRRGYIPPFLMPSSPARHPRLRVAHAPSSPA
ncbi:hypothetical protein BHE74_00053486 [Ensete ventricosum]|nr:hypothetical protein BHE74_00053486 [Ensete ventricosum]